MKGIFTKSISAFAIMLALGATTTAKAQDFVPVEYGKSYQVSKSNPVYLTIETSSPGTLMVQQWGTSDSHLFDNQTPKGIDYAIPSETYSANWDGGYDLPYSLNAGTYYFIAPFDNDGLTEAIITFEPSDGVNDVIELGVPFEAGNKVKAGVFHSTQEGVLQISTNYTGDLTMLYQILYSDVIFKDPVFCYNVRPTSNGSEYFFMVDADKDYYLYYDNILNPVIFTFTYAGGDAPQLTVTNTLIEPAPGNAFSTVQYPDGAQVIFSPQDVEWGDITFSYTSTESNETVTKTVTGSRILGGALRVNIADLYKQALEEVELGSTCKITINDVTFNGYSLTRSNVRGATVEDGNLTFEYVFANPPAVTTESLPKTFYSYWPEGSAAGVASFTFDQPIRNASNAQVIYAHAVPNEPTPGDTPPVYYTVAPTVEGNTVSYDLSGVHYDIDGKEITSYDGSEVTFYVPSVLGQNGLYAEFGTTGMSYISYIPYVDSPYEGGDEPENPTPGETPEVTLLSPPRGVATMYLMTATWGFTPLTAGTLEATLTLPDGSVVDYKGRIVDEDPFEWKMEGETNVDNAFSVLFGAGYNEEGEYILTIPAGSILINGTPNQETKISYLLGEVLTMGYAENVSNISTYTSFLPGLNLTWEYQTLYQEAEQLYVELSYNGGEPVKVTDVMLATVDPSEGGDEPGILTADATGNVLVIDFMNSIDLMARGTYVVTIPEGLVMNELIEINPEQKFTFHVLDADTDATFTPENNSELSADEATVKVTWEGYEVLTYNPESLNVSADSADGRSYLYFLEEVTIEEGALCINLGGLEDGSYNITLPEAYVVLGDNESFNAEAFMTYTVTAASGISSIIESENGVYRVYGINGQNIMTTGDASALKSLRKGIYVINGTKVIVR